MPPARALRAPADQGHEQGNQRRGDQQHQARDHIHRKQQHGKCHRQHGGGGHGRQVFGEEAIQRLDLVHHGAGQHARGLAPTPVRPLVHQALEQGQAHLALDPLGGDGAGAFAGPGDTGADQHQRGDAEDAAQQVRARRLPRDGGVQHAGQQPGLDHQQHAARERRGAGQQQGRPRRSRQTLQPLRLPARGLAQRVGGIMLQAAGAARRRRVPHAHASSRLARGSCEWPSRSSNHMALRMAKAQASPSPSTHEKYHIALAPDSV